MADEEAFRRERISLVNKIRKVNTAVSNYTDTDVEEYDVRTGDTNTKLNGIRVKMDEVMDLADDLIDQIEDDPDLAAKAIHEQDINNLKKDIKEKVVANEKKVKAKALTFLVPAVPTDGGPPPPPPGGGGGGAEGAAGAAATTAHLERLRLSEEKAKTGKLARIGVIQKQVLIKVNELIETMTKVGDTTKMKEGDVRQFLLESKDWVKKLEEVNKVMDSLEQDAAILEVNIEAEAKMFEHMKGLVVKKVDELKLIDKQKGYHSLQAAKSKEAAVYPEPFHGIFGMNVYRWCDDLKDAIESSQIREEDKVKKALQYLKGDAKIKVGDYHKDLSSVLESLRNFYGNPRAIWAKRRRDLQEAVGDIKKDWGEYGSQTRVLAIARVEDFIREAEILAKDFPESLEAEIYSSNTTALLRHVMPREYIEKVNDAVSEVDSSEKEKIDAIRKFLESRKRSALLGLDIEGEQGGAKKKINPSLNSSDEGLAKDRHDCYKNRGCKKEWHLFGCTEIYQLSDAKQRRKALINRRACVKCAAPFKKEAGGGLHVCKWESEKQATRCQAPACQYGAPACSDHEGIANCSQRLLDWIRSENVSTNVFILDGDNSRRSSVTGYEGDISSLEDSSEGAKADKRTQIIPDRLYSIKNRLAKRAYHHGIPEEKIVDIPEGHGTFEFAIVSGITRPHMSFIDTGATNWVVSENSVKDLISVKLREGPLPISIASGKVIQATGEWAALLPLTNGSYQAVRGLSMELVARKGPVFDFTAIFKGIQDMYPDNEELQNLRIPKGLGGTIDMIVGQRYRRVHPERVIKLPSGIEIGKSQFTPWNKGEVATISGPLDALASIIPDVNMQDTVKQLTDLIHAASELSLAASTDEHGMDGHYDMDIPGVLEVIRGDAEVEVTEEGLPCNCECGCFNVLEDTEEDMSCTVQGDLGRFGKLQDVGLDIGYRCPTCRDCLPCKRGAGNEKMSIIQEREQELIRKSVKIDIETGAAEAALPFKGDPKLYIINNRASAVKRLINVVGKYAKEPDTINQIVAAFDKMHDKGHLKYYTELNDEQRRMLNGAENTYYMPWDISFKEGSLSTPARPCFDASAVTSSGQSLNSILAIGNPGLVKLIKTLLEWTMGPNAMVGDISGFYPAVHLVEKHWQYQRILLTEGMHPEGKIIEAIIVRLIFGVCSSGGQLEEVVKQLAEVDGIKGTPVMKMLLNSRYVDDFMKSVKSAMEAKAMAADVEEALNKIGMKVKGWAFSGEAPSEEISSDEESIKVAGIIWYPRIDAFQIGVSPLFFGKKRRGRIPPGVSKIPTDFIKAQGTFGPGIDKIVPQNVTRENVTSIVCRVWDPLGMTAPLMNRFKCDLRKLVGASAKWNRVLEPFERDRWGKNIKLIEELREIVYVRSPIPSDALRLTARIFIMNDAALPAMMTGVYASYERRDGSWSCQLIFGKGLLSPLDKTLPQVELQALSNGGDVMQFMEQAIGDWIEEVFVFSDNEIALAWISYETIKLNTFERNRVQNIKNKVPQPRIMHVQGKLNSADVGTRPEALEVKDIVPGSVWMEGHPWMKETMEKAIGDGAIKSIEMIHLENEQKKILREGVTFDEFDAKQQFFAILSVSKENLTKIAERMEVSSYLYCPTKRNFVSMIRITAMSMKFIINMKRKIVVRKGMTFELAAIRFKMFCKNEEILIKAGPESELERKEFLEKFKNEAKQKYGDEIERRFELSDVHFSLALEHVYKQATLEVKAFNTTKTLEKLGVEKDGVIFSRTRILEDYEVRVLGELDGKVDLKQYTTVNFEVPIIDQYSPLAIPLVYHLHKFLNHKGHDSTFRLGLEYVSIMKSRHIFKRVGEECIRCLKKRGRFMEQIMGPLHGSTLVVTPIFYHTLVDIWGPLDVYCPGYEKVTRQKKAYKAYFMIFVCAATGTVNMQMVEGADTGNMIDGMNRFFSETCIPVIMYPDKAGALIKALTRGEVDVMDLSGRLYRQKGIKFEVCPPQGHSAHGRVERKIGLIQDSLNSSGMNKCRVTFSGWSTVAKLTEREINQIPLGYLSCKTTPEGSPLLKLLSPASMRLQSRTDRAPRSSFTIPNHPTDIMQKIDEIYQLWYIIWAESYVPIIMGQDKWLKSDRNLEPGDVVYFKLKESPMSATWKLGKVESIKTGRDGHVRDVMVAYKLIEGIEPDKTGKYNWRHMVVQRPVRNMIKLYAVEDTTLMSDMEEVRNSSMEIINKELEIGGGKDVESCCTMIQDMSMKEYEGIRREYSGDVATEQDFVEAYHYLHVISKDELDEQLFLL